MIAYNGSVAHSSPRLLGRFVQAASDSAAIYRSLSSVCICSTP
jgi:hypothetical protein